MEQGWERRTDTIAFEPEVLEAIARDHGGTHFVSVEELLDGGLVNQNYRVRLRDPDEDVVLRVYVRDPQAAAKEAAILTRIAGSVPAPRVLHRGTAGTHPCTILTWITGTALTALFQEADTEAIERAGREAGAAAARLHATPMPCLGFLDETLEVSEPMGSIRSAFESMIPSIERGHVGKRLGADLQSRLLAFLPNGLDALGPLEGHYAIVHGDFKPTNVLVHADGALAGLLDWEFAWAGPPLIDLGQMLRWPTPPGFEDALASGYRSAGGTLMPDWRVQARLLDLLNLISFLDTPRERPTLERDVRRMIRATLDATDS